LAEYIVDSKQIGQRLRALRGEKSLDVVAEDIGISRSALNMYELGDRVPRDQRKILLAEYYGVSMEQLFFSKE
jgi:transcriptional regulator with XRE-family HTH domain